MKINPPQTFTITHWQNHCQQQLSQLLCKQHYPETLLQAMQYSLLAPGKRLRPLLVYACGESYGAPTTALDYAAMAVECMHCYSLIHDDLPCMDNDELRRGQPTCHKKFDEATAVLAADALQCLTFQILSETPDINATQIQHMIHRLATAAGGDGMVAGQILDLQAEGSTPKIEAVEKIHRCKTGALITASLQLGAIAAGITPTHADWHNINQLGASLGLAFQIQDDWLEAVQSPQLGKSTFSDHNADKATYPKCIGLNKTEEYINHYYQKAQQAIKALSCPSDFLTTLLNYLRQRQQ